jgi:uncharacterized protein
MSIQVGYGLEGALPDAISNQIIQDEIAPRFRANDYNGGVSAGVDAIMKATRGEYKGTGRNLGSAARHAWIGPVMVTIGIWIFAIWLRRRVRGAVYGGRGAYYRRGWGGGFWPGYFIGSGGFRSGGGWGGSGSWGGGGGSWGGGGGGGGFSAGGGSFGGGGASGSW